MTEALIGGTIGLALVAGIWFGLNRLSGKRYDVRGWVADHEIGCMVAAVVAFMVASLVVFLWLAHADAEAHKGQHCVGYTTTYVPIKAGSVTILSPITECSQWAPNAPAAN